MKKFNLLLALLAFVGIGAFTSCSDDDAKPAPAISFDNGQSEFTLPAGTTTYTLNGQIKSEEGLASVRLMKVTGDSETQIGEAIKKFDNKNLYAFRFKVTGITAETKLKVEAEDKASQKSSKSFTVKVGSTAAEITNYSAKIFGAQSSKQGSYFASSTGMVYGKTDAQKNSAAIDMIYYYSTDAAVKAEIAAPSYDGFKTIVEGFGTKNTTKFKKVTVDFDTADAAKVAEVATGLTDDRVTALAVGNVFAFKTVAGKLGIAKVTALTEGADGNITVDVKVQK